MPDGGKKDVLLSASGLVIDANPVPDERIAIVAYVGPQDPEDPVQDVPIGWKAFRDAYTNYEYEIEGEKLYVVRRENIGVLVPPDTQIEQNNKDDVREGEYETQKALEDTQAERDGEFFEMINHKKIFGFT
jgi:co-chaperonin GroES (HSP10)